jgi:hypothetical protein
MSIVQESHVRTPVNQSLFIHFTVKFEPQVLANRALLAQETQRLLREVEERANTLVSQYNGVDKCRSTVFIVHESPMDDITQFQLSALSDDTLLVYFVETYLFSD